MRRPWHSWALFGACLAVLAAAMGWVTVTALRLDRAEAEARRQAALEENVRLALWRIDSLATALVAREGARPYFAYAPLYLEDRPYSRMTGDPLPGEDLIPSPLLGEVPDWVLLHFQIDERGWVTSPQVPTGQLREVAIESGTPRQLIVLHERALARLSGSLDRPALLDALPAAGDAPGPSVIYGYDLAAFRDDRNAQLPGGSQQGSSRTGGKAKAEWQARVNVANQAQRTQQRAVKEIYTQKDAPARQEIEPAPEQPPVPGAEPTGEVQEGLMTPLWSGERLLLARRVTAGRRELIQGCWLDWPSMRTALEASVGDLLPGADLVPADGEEGEESRMLATLPLRLVPGKPPSAEGGPLSPIRAALVLVWICVLLAAASVAFVLFGALSLSERRGAFVSAVTHELRTPLTTFRMYAEMLDEGMVRDEEKRHEYYRTLRGEADRLGHLVENVLAYSRLEGGRAVGRVESVELGAILDRVRDRLRKRAAESGMELVVEGSDGFGGTRVRADVSAAEQVLFNLVDNAAKYAASSGDRRIHLEAAAPGDRAVLRVRDHGPGLPAVQARRLFLPFSRPADAEADAPPGVGLGLALSRRLARAMGGDLALESSNEAGASFALSLPLAEPGS